MSGFITTATNAFGTASSLLSLLSGNPQAVVSIGNVELQRWALPETLAFGGEQMMIVDRLPGGAKAIQTLGWFDDPITFSAMLSGPNRFDFAQVLLQMARSGQTIPFVCLQLSHYVIIKKLTPAYSRWGWLTYSIEMEVVPPPPAAQGQSGTGALQSVAAGDIGSGQGFLGMLGSVAGQAGPLLAQAGAGLATAQGIVGKVAALTGSTALSSLTVSLAQFSGGANAAVGLADSAMGLANTQISGGFDPSLGSIGSQAQSMLTGMGDFTGIEAAGSAALGYIGRTVRNVAASTFNVGSQPVVGPPGSVAG